MDYLKTIKQFFKNDLKNTFTITFYVMILAILFAFPPKSYAADYNLDDPVLTYAGYLSIEQHFIDQGYDVCNAEYFVEVYGQSYWVFQSDQCFNGSSEPVPFFKNYKSSNYAVSNEYTIQNCFDAGLKILQVPSGLMLEGYYVCQPFFGESGSEPTEPTEPDDGILSPSDFDNFFCGNSYIKDKLSYAYYPLSEAVDYGVRRSLSSSQISGSDSLEIFVCPTTDDNPNGQCSHDFMVEQAREYLDFIPSERVHCFENEFGGCSTYEVFAYCETAIRQVSTSDITSDTSVDCRKTIYQFTGLSGEHLPSIPDSECYEDTNEDHTFKEWCSLQFDDSSYWVESDLSEYCDPPAKDTSEEKIDDGETCEITTETIDVGYETTETANNIVKDITKKVVVKDCDGTVISETIVESQIVVPKDEILGDGSGRDDSKPCLVGPYCPPKSGTSEGTGSGSGESEAGSSSGSGSDLGDVDSFDSSESWYTPVYVDGFEGVLNTHIDSFNNGGLGSFLSSLNPFESDGDFPVFYLDFDFGFVDFGEVSLDLENLPITDGGFNLIALLRIILLMSYSIYAFRQIF